MTVADLKRIVELLGARGSAAGLRASDVPLNVLENIAKKLKLTINKDIVRNDLIDILVERVKSAELRPIDELMQMNYDEIVKYFAQVGPSNGELLNLMKELNYKVSAEDKKHLRKFVARQISETALFSRVASREESNDSAIGVAAENRKKR